MARLGVVQYVSLDPKVHEQLRQLAELEKRPVQNLAGILITYALWQLTSHNLTLSAMLQEMHSSTNPTAAT